MDKRFTGPYVAVEDVMRRKLKMTLKRGTARLAKPIEVLETSRFFSLCCRNPDAKEMEFNKFGESPAPGKLSYCLVIYDETRALKWFEDALMLAAQ
jgi:hypothetical protein